MKKLRRIIFTKEGYEKLKAEYETLKKDRVQAVATLKQARDLGDLSENGLYKAARARLSGIDAQLRRMDFHLKLGIIAEKSSNAIAGISSKVTISDGNSQKTYEIVGELEANPSEHKITPHSPLGKALLGKSEGESVELFTPSGKKAFHIKHIE